MVSVLIFMSGRFYPTLPAKNLPQVEKKREPDILAEKQKNTNYLAGLLFFCRFVTIVYIYLNYLTTYLQDSIPTTNTHMAMKSIFLFSPIIAILLASDYCYGQNYNQNTNVNQNTVIVNNAPVIVKTEYVDRYRTVYVNRPQPVRVAKKLPAPIQLHGYLWVYPEDIGDFRQQADASGVIRDINAQNPYGRNDWRIPTPGELALLENEADKVGLGDGIYLATNHANGILRMVSTGASVAQQNAERNAEAAREIAEQRRVEAERRRQAEARVRAEQLAAAESRRVAAAAARSEENALWIRQNPILAIERHCGLIVKVRAHESWNDRNDCGAGWRLATDAEIARMYSIGDGIFNNYVGDDAAGHGNSRFLLSSDSRLVRSYYQKMSWNANGKHAWVLEVSNIWRPWGKVDTVTIVEPYNSKSSAESFGENDTQRGSKFVCIDVKVQ